MDGLDGSALYANGLLDLVCISAGVIKDGQPFAGLVFNIGREETWVANDNELTTQNVQFEKLKPLPESLVGLDDCKDVDNNFRNKVVAKLNSTREFRYPLNSPSCSGALGVLRGSLAAYVTSNARHWDIAGVAALFAARKTAVAETLAGEPLPHDVVRMPPLLFARDKETAATVRSLVTF